MARFWFLGSNVYVQSSVTDANGAPITPTTITVAVTDPAGVAETVTTPTATGTGNYQAEVSPAVLAGDHAVAWTVTASGDTNVIKYSYTVLSTVPVVSFQDLSIYLGSDTLDQDRATLTLAAAQALCESVVSPLPQGAFAVVLDVAVRALSNPTGASQQAVGPFPVTFPVGGLMLTRANERTLRRLAGSGGAFSINLLSGYAGPSVPVWDVSTSSFAVVVP